MKTVILASTSPRRIEILQKSGLKFQAVASNYEEDMNSKLKPLELAKFLSYGKAQALINRFQNHIIIGADTFIVLGDRILGKPHTVSEARKMLRRISGRAVSVITGFTIIDTELRKKISKAIETKVFFKKLTGQEIDNYIKTKEPLDKAGAFAIQGLGAVFVRRIEGDYYNVMGLPLYDLIQALKKFKVDCFQFK